MKVAVVHNLARGGARTRLLHQLEHLGAETTEFVLGTATPISDDAVIVPYAEAAARVHPALRPVLRHTDHVRMLLAWRRLARLVDEGDFDVVLANPCRFLQSPAALRWLRTPALYFCDEPRRIDHEPELRTSVNPRTTGLYAVLYRARTRSDRAAATAANRVAANSSFTAARIAAAYGVQAVPVRLGAAEIFSGEPHARGTHLLSVGTLLSTKGHHLVVDTAARTRTPWPVVIVAPRPDPVAKAALHERAAAQGVRLSVRIAVSTDELAELFRTAQATLYLAAREPLGLVSLEAQRSACPVVVADEGGLPETVDPGVTGWAVRRDPVCAAEAVDRLEDADVRLRMATAARAWAADWTWSRSAHRVRALLAAL